MLLRRTSHLLHLRTTHRLLRTAHGLLIWFARRLLKLAIHLLLIWVTHRLLRRISHLLWRIVSHLLLLWITGWLLRYSLVKSLLLPIILFPLSFEILLVLGLLILIILLRACTRRIRLRRSPLWSICSKLLVISLRRLIISLSRLLVISISLS